MLLSIARYFAVVLPQTTRLLNHLKPLLGLSYYVTLCDYSIKIYISIWTFKNEHILPGLKHWKVLIFDAHCWGVLFLGAWVGGREQLRVTIEDCEMMSLLRYSVIIITIQKMGSSGTTIGFSNGLNLHRNRFQPIVIDLHGSAIGSFGTREISFNPWSISTATVTPPRTHHRLWP